MFWQRRQRIPLGRSPSKLPRQARYSSRSPPNVRVSSFLSIPHERCPRIDPQAEQFHADSPFPRSDQLPAAVLWGTSVKYYEEAGRSHDNTPMQPNTARDAHGCCTGDMRTSENAVTANFAE